jgi:hypothetical protein
MSFFNSLSTRIPLAIAGGILYAGLTHYILILLNLPSDVAVFAAIIVFVFYLSSRFLLLFSGIDSPYYSKMKKRIPKPPIETSSFYQTAQWVGKFYHYHDMVLFIFLGLLAISFLITLGVDGWSGIPFGKTAQDLYNSLIQIP